MLSQSKKIILWFFEHDTIARSYLLVTDYTFLLHRSKLEEGLCSVKLVEKMQHLPSSNSENLIMRSSLRLPCVWYGFFYTCLSPPLYLDEIV